MAEIPEPRRLPTRFFIEPRVRIGGRLMRCVAPPLTAEIDAGISSPAGSPLELKPEDADQESLAAHQALSDVWQRSRKLFLETFVWNENLHLRRNLIASLNLDVGAYPDSHKPLVARAIDIARKHPDDYIRHRLQVQLAETHLLWPLPRRER
jgi:hypothetical protein